MTQPDVMKFEMSKVMNVRVMIWGPEYLGNMIRRKFCNHPLVHVMHVCVYLGMYVVRLAQSARPCVYDTIALI